jgi:hypothetical protein
MDAAGWLVIIPLVLFAGAVVVVAVVRFVQFWVAFAQGINEARGEPRGFEVKLDTGETPVRSEERQEKC